MEYEENRVKARFDFIKGESIDVTNPIHWNVRTFEQIGRILGRMHALAKTFKVDQIYRPMWTEENPDVFGIRGNLTPWLSERYEQLMHNLSTYPILAETYGLVHNDFHQVNLIMNSEGNITPMDFDECAYNWFAQDLAVVFYHAYWQHSSFNEDEDHTFTQTFMSHVFKGYKEGNLLHEDKIKQIPTFLKLREIFFYQLFKGKWNSKYMEELQKYTLVDLEDKIKNSIPYVGVQEFSSYYKLLTNEQS